MQMLSLDDVSRQMINSDTFVERNRRMDNNLLKGPSDKFLFIMPDRFKFLIVNFNFGFIFGLSII